MGGSGQSDDELRQRLSDSLSRFGVAGEVTIHSGQATLHGNGPTVTVGVGSLLDEWQALTDEQRQRRVNDVARKLSGERRTVFASDGPAARSDGTPLVAKLGIGLAIVVAAFGLRILYRLWDAAHAESTKPKPLIQDYDAYERARAERAARTCEATRSRVMRGATVGPSDVEGWVVELWALRSATKPSLVDDPGLATFVSRPTANAPGRVVWAAAAPSLSGAAGPGTEVTVVPSDVPATGGPAYRGVKIVFSGHYVVPYFNEPERLDYLRFARVATDTLGVDYAALYARCAAGTSHHLGSWFRGPNAAGALTSLLYFMGVFIEHPDIQPTLLAPPGSPNVDPAFALQSVMHATATMKKAQILTLVSDGAGMVSGTDDQVATITFPFRDGNRASRSSHIAARKLGIGDGL